MTRPRSGAAGRQQIPGFGKDQPPAEVVDAYWTRESISPPTAGMPSASNSAHTATAFVTAHTPTAYGHRELGSTLRQWWRASKFRETLQRADCSNWPDPWRPGPKRRRDR